MLRGWPDAWTGEDKAIAEQALVDHQNWPRIAVPVVESLKDLGVAIGSGAAGKLQHQQRLLQVGQRSGPVRGEAGAARGQLSHPGGPLRVCGPAA